MGWVLIVMALNGFIIPFPASALADAVYISLKDNCSFQKLLLYKSGFCVPYINKPVQPVYVCAPFGNLTLLWHCVLLRLHLFLLQFFTLWSLKKANLNLTYSQSWWTLQTHFRRMHAGSSRYIFFCLLVHLPRITALGPFAFFFPQLLSDLCQTTTPAPASSHSMFWFVVFL